VSDPRPDAIIGQLADENLIDQLAAANAALEARVAELEAEVAWLTEALTVDHLRVALACIETIHGEEPRWDAGAAKAIRRAIEATEGKAALLLDGTYDAAARLRAALDALDRKDTP
jgi:hypothetical protein